MRYFNVLVRAIKGGVLFTVVSLLATAPWAPRAEAATARSQQAADANGTDVSSYSPGSNNLALDVGQVFLMGNLSEQYTDSIGTQLHYTYGVSDLFGFDASAGYSSHSNGNFSMATALFGLRTNLSYYDKIVPYSIFGMGFYKPSYAFQTSSGGQGTLSPILFGLHLGFGTDLLISRSVFFGAGLTLHDVFGSDQTTSAGGTISTGGTFISFLLHAGYSF